MLARESVDRVKVLLAEGKLSRRKIAVATGVSRSAVAAIASGERDRYPLSTFPKSLPFLDWNGVE